MARLYAMGCAPVRAGCDGAYFLGMTFSSAAVAFVLGGAADVVAGEWAPAASMGGVAAGGTKAPGSLQGGVATGAAGSLPAFFVATW